MHVNDVNIFAHAQNPKAKTVTQKRVDRAIEQNFLNRVTACTLVAQMKLLAQPVVDSIGRIFRDLFDIDAFAAFLRRPDKHAVNHFAFSLQRPDTEK